MTVRCHIVFVNLDATLKATAFYPQTSKVKCPHLNRVRAYARTLTAFCISEALVFRIIRNEYQRAWEEMHERAIAFGWVKCVRTLHVNKFSECAMAR